MENPDKKPLTVATTLPPNSSALSPMGERGTNSRERAMITGTTPGADAFVPLLRMKKLKPTGSANGFRPLRGRLRKWVVSCTKKPAKNRIDLTNCRPKAAIFCKMSARFDVNVENEELKVCFYSGIVSCDPLFSYTFRLRTYYLTSFFSSCREMGLRRGSLRPPASSPQGRWSGRPRCITTFIFMNIVAYRLKSLVFMNIVGVAKTDIFSTCVFNNIVGVASFFNSLFSLRSRLRIQLNSSLSYTYIFWNFFGSAPNYLLFR